MRPYFTRKTAPGLSLEELHLMNGLWLLLKPGQRTDPAECEKLLEEWRDSLEELRAAVKRASIVADVVENPVHLYISWYESADGKYRVPIFETHSDLVDSNPPEGAAYGPMKIDSAGLLSREFFDWAQLGKEEE